MKTRLLLILIVFAFLSAKGAGNPGLKTISLNPSAQLTRIGNSATLVTYKATVAASLTSVTQTITAVDAAATITVNGAIVASGAASASIPLNPSGTTTIITVITSGANSRTYQVIIGKSGSSNAKLQSIALTPAAALTLTSNTTELVTYTTSVSSSVTSVTEKAVVSDPASTMTINGVNVASGSSSGSIPLNASGTTTITTVVTAQTGNTRTYQIIISKNGSANANLQSISLTPASTLTLASSSATLVTYTTSVNTAVTSVTQKAVVSDPTATMTVDGVSVASGASSASIPLNSSGTTTITTIVTAENGNTRTYQVIISKNGSANANLQSISITPTSLLTLVRNSATLVTYTTSVGVSVTSVTQNAVVSDPTATMTVNGVTVASGVSSASISLNAGGTTTITTIVTAENGNTRTYEIIISKAGSASTTWLGSVDNAWEVAGNWSAGVPASNSDVTIPASANMPVISVASTCKSITISGTTTLTLSSSLTVTNSLTVNNGFILSVAGPGAGTIGGTASIGDNAGITNSSTINAGQSGVACIINLSGANSSIINSGTFNLGPTSVINPTGASALLKNNAPGVFTLQSDASGTAAITQLSTTALCTGNFNVERFIHGSNNLLYRNYRFMSSPVYTSSQIVGGLSFNAYDLKYLDKSDPTYPITTGTGGTANGFDKSGNPTIYVYREDRNADNSVFSGGNFIGISNITGSALGYDSNNNTTTGGYLPVGNGFVFFYRGTKASLVGRTTLPITPSNYPDDTKVTQVGALNQGDVPVNLWYNNTTPNSNQSTLSFTASNTSLSQGVNLVGNPYASAIDWNSFYNNTGIQSSHVFPTYYLFNFLNHQYEPYMNIGPGLGVTASATLTNIIPSGQGFFVLTDAAGAQLKFTEGAKSSTSPNQNTLLMGVPQGQGAYDVRQMLRLKLFIDTLNYDDIVIAFNSNSSMKYNNMEDSQYLTGMNAAEGLASFSSDPNPVALSINFLPLPKKKQEVIKLLVQATNSGRLTLQKTQLDSLPKIYELWLIDNYKKDSLDLRSNATYAFDINKADAASFGNNRFQVVVRQNKALGIHLLDFTATKTPGGVPVAWKTENEESYTNFTVERSTDNGVTFDVLGGFASNGQGTYNFTDKNPVNTVDIYRLKIEDLNGDITYSKAIAVVYDASKVIAATTKVNVYPNPASGVVNVAITQPGFVSTNLSGVQSINHVATLASAQAPTYGIKIISITGAVIKTETSATPTWQDNVSALLPGTYFIQVTNNSDNSVIGKSSFIKL